MTPIKPEALGGQAFPKTDFGYDPAEVDEHIRRLTENYSFLYRENAALLKQLRETGERLRALEKERSDADSMLESARAQSDRIIEEAYIKADDILASVQTSCDAILRHFKEKAEAQEKTLTEMKQHILKFKNELFEQYRLHINMIEALFPTGEEEKNWTPDAYAQHIVAELKRKISAQYEIFPETSPLSPPWDGNEEALAMELLPLPEDPVRKRASAKKKAIKKTPSVMELIDEYEDPSLKCGIPPVPAQQFMLDFDHPAEDGVTINKKL